MGREEFFRFMKDQIYEINKYKSRKLKSNKDFDSNSCVFEWIDNNAKRFCAKWEKKRHS